MDTAMNMTIADMTIRLLCPSLLFVQRDWTDWRNWNALTVCGAWVPRKQMLCKHIRVEPTRVCIHQLERFQGVLLARFFVPTRARFLPRHVDASSVVLPKQFAWQAHHTTRIRILAQRLRFPLLRTAFCLLQCAQLLQLLTPNPTTPRHKLSMILTGTHLKPSAQSIALFKRHKSLPYLRPVSRAS